MTAPTVEDREKLLDLLHGAYELITRVVPDLEGKHWYREARRWQRVYETCAREPSNPSNQHQWLIVENAWALLRDVQWQLHPEEWQLYMRRWRQKYFIHLTHTRMLRDWETVIQEFNRVARGEIR